MAKKHLNAFVTETYQSGSEEKTNYTKVGALFPHEKGKGFTLKLLPNLSVSDEIVFFPPSENSGGDSANAN
ncbi:MAG: hypothetical protein AAF098_06295 [Pseudomonadota bacterium]